MSSSPSDTFGSAEATDMFVSKETSPSSEESSSSSVSLSYVVGARKRFCDRLKQCHVRGTKQGIDVKLLTFSLRETVKLNEEHRISCSLAKLYGGD